MQIYHENFWIIYLIIAGFAVTGIILLCIGVVLRLANRKKCKFYMQPITATVTDLRKEAMLKISTDYEVYTAFCTIKGETFRKEAFIDTKNPDVAAGDIIYISFIPDNPEEFSGSVEKRIFLQKLLIGIGIGIICFALILLLVPTHVHF